MTLRAKTFLLTTSGLGLLLLTLYAVTSLFLIHNFRRSDEVKAQRVLTESLNAIQSNNRQFIRSYRDYGTWTQTWDFVRNPNPQYLSQNLNTPWLNSVDIDFVAIVAANGKIIWDRQWDSETETLRPTPPFVRALYRPKSRLLRHENARDVHSGLLDVDGRPLIVASVPIVRSDYSGEIRGSFVVARWLTRQRLKSIGDLVSAELALQRVTRAQQASSLKPFFNDDFGTVGARAPLNDLNNQPRWILTATVSAEASQESAQHLRLLSVVLLLAFGLACLFTLWPVESLVLRRLSHLSRELRVVRKSEALDSRVSVAGHDEIAELSSDINATLETLAALDRQKTESEALQRELALTALTAGDCYFIFEPTSRLMQWQGDIDAQLGYAHGAFPRSLEGWQGHVHPDDLPRLNQAYESALREGTSFEIELRVYRADGQMLHWAHRGRLLVDNQHDKLLGVCLDVTARKNSEAARRRTEARLARIVETSADAIVLFDTQGQVIFANAGAADMFGCRVEELWSRHYTSPEWGTQTLDGSVLPPAETAFSRVERGRSSVYGLQQIMRGPAGENIVVAINAAPLPDENGDFAGVVVSLRDVSAHLELQNRLAHQAFHDALTGLANRALMRDRLAHALALAKRSDCEIGVLFIDLDNFKWVNDSLGHEAGDDLLREVAARLVRSLRESDTAARFGGDEFVVLLESVENPKYSMIVAERLVTVLSEPFRVAGREVFTSPSIGLTFSEKDSDVETMLRQADAAMYEAKRRGKGRFEVFQQTLSAAALERLDTEADLRRALGNDEFFLVYQPKIELSSGDVLGVEVLLRWNHPQKGLVPPVQFVSVAEETGLIVPIGQFVLQAACAQMQEWNRGREMLGMAPLKVAVNVSARQFHTAKLGNDAGDAPQLVNEIEIILAQTGLRPADLILEITESLLMERTKESLQVMQALKQLGVNLAIDDFGTGYSSLAYLRAFPFDYLKIDREFVKQIDSESGPGVIVGSIISLAHALDLKVIAEGAERPEEVEKLGSLGCDFAQGYYFSRPLPAREIERMLFPDAGKTEKAKTQRPLPRLVR